MLRRRLTTILALLVVAIPAAAVLAQAQSQDPDPAASQYEAPIPDASGTGEASNSAQDTGLESRIGFLPFTGLDLLVICGVALVLTGAGFALRRLSDPPPPLS